MDKVCFLSKLFYFFRFFGYEFVKTNSRDFSGKSIKKRLQFFCVKLPKIYKNAVFGAKYKTLLRTIVFCAIDKVVF